jgi:CheY-like chemotaxis protein
MEGEISIKSKLGHGTTVTVAVTLPIAATEAVSPFIEYRGLQSRSLNLLVVEDTEVNQVLLQKSLQKAGHRVTLAADGESACQVYRDGRFDAIIVDLQLPGIDGAETTNRMRQASLAEGQGPPPMICLTAYAEPTIALSHALTFDAYLTKPIRREVLLATLNDFTFEATDLSAAEKIDPELLEELTEVFVATSPGLVAELRDAVEASDLRRIGVLTHKLLGQLPYFDARELEARVGELEAAAARGDDRLGNFARQVETSFEALLLRLKGDESPAPVGPTPTTAPVK